MTAASRVHPALRPFLDLRAAIIESGAQPRVDDEATGGHPSGLTLCRRLTATLDRCLGALLPPGAGRLALVAVGGYGRGEQCLSSDVDLMLLHTGNAPAKAAEQVWYPLWDAGLKLGHSVRTVREAAQAAREHLDTLTALLDARLVAGDADLVGELRHALAEAMRRGRLDPRAALTAADAERRAREPYLLQAPDLKTSRGGLRALQALHWQARARELGGHEAPHPWDELALHDERDLILATRNALHAVSGKLYDQYAADLQPAVAGWLGVEGTAWSRRLYRGMHRADRLARGFWLEPVCDGREAAGPAAAGGGAGRWRRVLPGIGRVMAGSAVEPAVTVQAAARPAGEQVPAGGSVLALAAAVAGRPDGCLFDEAAAAAVRRAMGPMWTAGDRADLIALLRAAERGQDVFDALDALGWLERALPEWAHVRGLPQFAPFHLHPVDAHLWRTVAETVRLAQRDSPEPRLTGVAAELDSLDDSLLAALLHDIGKGWPGDHAVVGAKAARAFCRRAGFGPRTVAAVERAVAQHLLLPLVATRRDLDDPAVVGEVADAVGDRRTLRILYLLAVADSRATGPAVWNGWKASLLHTLYERTDDELRRRERAVQPPAAPFDPKALLALLGGAIDERTVREHVAAMPPGYVQSWTAAEVAGHVRQMWPPPGPGEVRLRVGHTGATDEVLLVCEDRPGLLATVSGVLAVHSIGVLGGRLLTRADGVALEALHVVDAVGRGSVPEERWARVRRDLPLALRGELPIETLLAEKHRAYGRPARAGIALRVVIDARSSGRATLIEVHAEDQAGLLHRVSRALYRQELDITLAKVDTLGREVVDVFYVRDLDGQPPRAPERLAAIEAAVLAELRGEHRVGSIE